MSIAHRVSLRRIVSWSSNSVTGILWTVSWRVRRRRLTTTDRSMIVSGGVLIIARASGAQVLDLCSAYVGRDEAADLTTLVERFAGAAKAPIMIDSTTPGCIEACLRRYPGRAIINSINLDDGAKWITPNKVTGFDSFSFLEWIEDLS